MAKGPGQMNRHRPGVVLCAVLTAAALMSACANAPSTTTTQAPAPAQASLQELMQQAQTASKEGQRERARQAWRSAAKAYPTQKAPWQRLAEDYFEAADYGNAILAAQEVLQRDDQDTLAHSVLAVSGLRLSTVSLVALRERTNYPVGSREEAVGLTRAMREALGENALVPLRSTDAAAASTRSNTTTSAPAAQAAARTAPPPSAKATATATAAPVAGNTPAPTARPTTHAAPATAARPSATTPSGVMPVVAPANASPQAKPAADPFKLLK